MSLENTKEVLVLDYFLNNHDNSVKNIANYVGISEGRVHRIIDKYLEKKT